MSARDEDLYEDAVLEDRAARESRYCPHCVGRGCPACWVEDDEEEVQQERQLRPPARTATPILPPHCGARHEGLSNPGGHQSEGETT